MKEIIAIGIDPGIANCGLALIEGCAGYSLLDTKLVKTDSNDPLGVRLDTIYQALCTMVESPPAEELGLIAIERCFHNKNISSSATTQQVIGLVHWTVYQFDVPVIELTPQALKRACGLGPRAKKNEMLRSAKGLLKHDFESHHCVDAAFAAIGGILHKRAKTCRNL